MAPLILLVLRHTSLFTLRSQYQPLSGQCNDLGQAQRDKRAKIRRAIELKRHGPHLSDLVINQMLRHEFGSDLASSTLYRHLRIQGASRKRLGLQKEKVRCQWTRDTANALWMGDFSHGPIVLCDGQPKQTHLSAWIDMHSRYVVEARFYFRENLDFLIDSLLRAWAIRQTLKRSE